MGAYPEPELEIKRLNRHVIHWINGNYDRHLEEVAFEYYNKRFGEDMMYSSVDAISKESSLAIISNAMEYFIFSHEYFWGEVLLQADEYRDISVVEVLKNFVKDGYGDILKDGELVATTEGNRILKIGEPDLFRNAKCRYTPGYDLGNPGANIPLKEAVEKSKDKWLNVEDRYNAIKDKYRKVRKGMLGEFQRDCIKEKINELVEEMRHKCGFCEYVGTENIKFVAERPYCPCPVLEECAKITSRTETMDKTFDIDRAFINIDISIRHAKHAIEITEEKVKVLEED